MIKVSEFKERREKLYNKLNDESVLILYSGVAKKRSADEDFPFVVNRNFYYLTNIKQENSVLVVTKLGGIIKEYLFINEYSELKEKWTGRRITPQEARTLSDIPNILFTPTFDAQLQMILNNSNSIDNINYIYMDLEKENKIGPETSTNDVANTLSLNYSNKKII